MAAFSQKAFDAVCDMIAEGHSLRAISKMDGMPNARDVTRWMDADPAIVPQYARAREGQADKLFEECLTIADSQEGDVVIVDGAEVTNHDAIQRAKLRIDTRKWMAGKLRPKVYGDKVDVSGNVGFTVTIAGDDANL